MEDLKAIVEEQRKRLAAQLAADHRSATDQVNEFIEKVVLLCVKIMGKAATKKEERRVIGFASDSVTDSMNNHQWVHLVRKLIDIGYSATFTDDEPKFVILPGAQDYVSYARIDRTIVSPVQILQ